MIQLDDIDRRIIRELQTNARISHQDLAEKVGSSPASCWRRIKALEQVGVLLQTVRVVDPAIVGLGLDAFCHVRMRDQSTKARRAFEVFLQQQAEVMECYSVTGEWDYLLHVVVGGIAEFERVLMGGILDHPSIANTSSIFALKRVKQSSVLPL